ncbi:Hsp20/alpha crystallin family protein [Variovorax boronicumulans]|uniref:Hsp20/alpha crystallin family protein n=1 Tax=Variovorax boronicumulans TaxID=436515 RepID=UPI003391A351
MYRSLFPRDLFAEMDRLQRDVQQAFDLSPTIRGFARNGFPALNVGSTPEALEIYAFAPGVDPATLELSLERGLLTISGERKSPLPEAGEKAAVHINERFEGAFRRVMTLPDDADPDAVDARLQDGVLHITVQRRASAQPRRIAIQ